MTRCSLRPIVLIWLEWVVILRYVGSLRRSVELRPQRMKRHGRKRCFSCSRDDLESRQA